MIKVKGTHPNLQAAFDIEELNRLVKDELFHSMGSCNNDGINQNPASVARSLFAPEEVNKAFAGLIEKGFDSARPARTIYWMTGMRKVRRVPLADLISPARIRAVKRPKNDFPLPGLC